MLGIPTRAHKSYELKLGVVQMPKKRTAGVVHILLGKSSLDNMHMFGYIALSLCVPGSGLRELRRRAHLLQWKPFPKPLTPKHPLKINDIGPLIALV